MSDKSEKVRKLREVSNILLTILRCVAMKRALNATENDHLSFFTLYDACLMDVAVINWWKLFGKWKDESHWRNLFFENEQPAIEKRLAATLTLQNTNIKTVRSLVETYRHQSIAHHSFDTETRPSKHIGLDPLQATALVIYRKAIDNLSELGYPNSFPDPISLSGANLADIENHWSKIVTKARDATRNFADAPPKY